MPNRAWLSIVHLKGYFFPFFSITVSGLADLPGLIVTVFLPAILKSWLALPLFTTLKITFPAGALFFERMNLYSLATTLIVVVFCFAAGCAAAKGATAMPVAVTAAAATSRYSVRFMDLL